MWFNADCTVYNGDCSQNETCSTVDLKYAKLSVCRCSEGFQRRKIWENCISKFFSCYRIQKFTCSMFLIYSMKLLIDGKVKHIPWGASVLTNLFSCVANTENFAIKSFLSALIKRLICKLTCVARYARLASNEFLNSELYQMSQFFRFDSYNSFKSSYACICNVL